MKQLRFVIIAFVASFYLQTCFAYNHRKCMVGTRDYNGIVGVFISSSSFTTSTGDCAMFGSIKEKKQHFIAFNSEQLKVDIARGGGEYLEAYAELSGCRDSAQLMSQRLQKSFQDIYGDHEGEDNLSTFNNIESLIKSDANLKTNCKNES